MPLTFNQLKKPFSMRALIASGGLHPGDRAMLEPRAFIPSHLL